MSRIRGVFLAQLLVGAGVGLSGCSQDLTETLAPLPNRPAYTVYDCENNYDPLYCDGGGGGGGGGATSMTYYAPVIIVGDWKSFPYSYIGTSSHTYNFGVTYMGSETAYVDGSVRWGTTNIASFLVGNYGTFSATTTTGAGSPDVRAKSEGILPITFTLNCSNCQ